MRDSGVSVLFHSLGVKSWPMVREQPPRDKIVTETATGIGRHDSAAAHRPERRHYDRAPTSPPKSRDCAPARRGTRRLALPGPGSSAAWLARSVRDAEAGGSNPPFPTHKRPGQSLQKRDIPRPGIPCYGTFKAHGRPTRPQKMFLRGRPTSTLRALRRGQRGS